MYDFFHSLPLKINDGLGVILHFRHFTLLSLLPLLLFSGFQELKQLGVGLSDLSASFHQQVTPLYTTLFAALVYIFSAILCITALVFYIADETADNLLKRSASISVQIITIKLNIIMQIKIKIHHKKKKTQGFFFSQHKYCFCHFISFITIDPGRSPVVIKKLTYLYTKPN